MKSRTHTTPNDRPKKAPRKRSAGPKHKYAVQGTLFDDMMPVTLNPSNLSAMIKQHKKQAKLMRLTR